MSAFDGRRLEVIEPGLQLASRPNSHPRGIALQARVAGRLMKTVTLINPPGIKTFSSIQMQTPGPPTGLAYIAGVLNSLCTSTSVS